MKNIRLLVLWLTNDCNLRCRYCYANAGDKKEYMTFETARNAIDRIRSDSFRIQLAGGEPLLNMELVKSIYSYIKSAGIPATLQMQTNGTLITGRTAKELKHMDIAMGVSMDGGVEVNEALRGSTGDVLEGIHQLAQVGIGLNLNCVVTSLNVSSLYKLVDMAFYFGNVQGIGLDLLRKTGRAEDSNIDTAAPGEIRIGLLAAYERARQLNKISGKKIVIREIEDAKKRLIAGTACKGYCHASTGGSMVVLPDGSLYPCGSLAGRQEYLMGNAVGREIRTIKLKTGGGRNCASCKYEKICPGGCPSRMIVNSGSSDQDQDCALRKKAFEIAEMEIASGT